MSEEPVPTTPREGSAADAAAVEAAAPRGWRRLVARLDRRFVAAGLGAIGLLILGLWWVFYGSLASPAELREQALELLAAESTEESRAELEEVFAQFEHVGSRDDAFPGALEFLRGLAVLREADTVPGTDFRAASASAVEFLEQAEQQGLDEAHRPDWAFALGRALAETGRVVQAQSLLEEAVESLADPATKQRAALLLADLLVDRNLPDGLERAEALNQEVLAAADLPADRRDEALLQRGRILLRFRKLDEAARQIADLSPDGRGSPAAALLESLLDVAAKKYRPAVDRLRPLVDDEELDPLHARRAQYLAALASLQLGETEPAIVSLEKTARNHEGTPEGLAAGILAAVALRGAGRDEEALEDFRRALAQIGDPLEFRNRWVALEDLRRIVLDTWNHWVARHRHAEAIELAQLAPPLLPQEQAEELVAQANERWALALEQALANTPAGDRPRRQDEIRERWQSSGRAFATLAATLAESPRRAEILWTAADHLQRGRDYPGALEQLTAYLATDPQKELPTALVRRGRILLDLGRNDEALEDFKRVTVEFPTSPSAFEATFLLGRTHLERNDLDAAEDTWRRILADETLSPAASEWRSALFALGRLQHQRASLAWSKASSRPAGAADEAHAGHETEAFRRWNDGLRLLDEFLRRYPDAPEVHEARYFHARALQLSAEQPRRRLQAAETENAKLELRRQVRTLLEAAVAEYRRLQKDLLVLEQPDRLDDLQKRFLRDCFFEIAHTYYALERHEEAVVAYGSAANRYPESPLILVAYIQMTNCYDQLGRPAEARSMIQQARIILNQMPEGTFQPPATNLTRDEWRNWLDWARRLHQSRTPRAAEEAS